ncbi:MAG: tryptophan 7-halogenase [Henriciella sp.]|nr:tryptophan 7-halogenase [Henriciella sp.]
MSHPDAIQKIVILGGGTAGWMTAATLAHLLDANRVSVTLIESEQIGTVGVGEATIPPILLFNQMLGIDEKAFIRETKATFKLGIEFVNWGGLGEAYIHPFGDFATDIETLPMHHHWLRAKAAGYDRNLFDFSLMVQACRRGRFVHPVTNNPRSVLAGVHYAYQFDASLYAAYLRSYAEQRGVKRVEGRVASVDQNSETGFVESLKLEDGQSVDGEFFIDCSGFRGILIEQTLNCGYQDWSHWLPVDRAVAVPCEKAGPALPYTRSTAHGAGWQWRIPLQHRTGNGHVYCSEFISDDEAHATLLEGLDGKPVAEPNFLRFKTGHRRKFFDKNVLALGLSAGFMEPLESTSIHLIQTGIARLMALFPDKRFTQVDTDAYNQRTLFEYERVRDFLILHYVATNRDDTPFWRHCQSLPVPDTLQQKIDQYRSAGRIFRESNELFTESSWLAVMHGQGIEADAWNPIADRFDGSAMIERLDGMADIIARATEAMPEHEAYIQEMIA